MESCRKEKTYAVWIGGGGSGGSGEYPTKQRYIHLIETAVRVIFRGVLLTSFLGKLTKLWRITGCINLYKSCLLQK